MNCPFTLKAQCITRSVSVCLQIWQPGLGQGEWVFSWTLLAEWKYWNRLIFSQAYFYGDMYVLQESAFSCNTVCVHVCVRVCVRVCACVCVHVCVFSLTGARLTQNIFLYLWLSGIRQCSTCTYIWLCNRSGTKLIQSLIFLFFISVKPFGGSYGFDSKLGSAIPGGDMGPAWQGRSIAGPKLRMVEFSAFLEQQRDPDSVSISTFSCWCRSCVHKCFSVTPVCVVNKKYLI